MVTKLADFLPAIQPQQTDFTALLFNALRARQQGQLEQLKIQDALDARKRAEALRTELGQAFEPTRPRPFEQTGVHPTAGVLSGMLPGAPGVGEMISRTMQPVMEQTRGPQIQPSLNNPQTQLQVARALARNGSPDDLRQFMQSLGKTGADPMALESLKQAGREKLSDASLKKVMYVRDRIDQLEAKREENRRLGREESQQDKNEYAGLLTELRKSVIEYSHSLAANDPMGSPVSIVGPEGKNILAMPTKSGEIRAAPLVVPGADTPARPLPMNLDDKVGTGLEPASPEGGTQIDAGTVPPTAAPFAPTPSGTPPVQKNLYAEPAPKAGSSPKPVDYQKIQKNSFDIADKDLGKDLPKIQNTVDQFISSNQGYLDRMRTATDNNVYEANRRNYDKNLIAAIAKLTDPISVIRESEIRYWSQVGLTLTEAVQKWGASLTPGSAGGPVLNDAERESLTLALQELKKFWSDKRLEWNARVAKNMRFTLREAGVPPDKIEEAVGSSVSGSMAPTEPSAAPASGTARPSFDDLWNKHTGGSK